MKYTTAEAAKLLGVSKSTLLNWEKNGSIAPAKRERRGGYDWRFYTDSDLESIRKKVGLPPRMSVLDPNRTIAEVCEDVLEHCCGEQSGERSFSVNLRVSRNPDGVFF